MNTGYYPTATTTIYVPTPMGQKEPLNHPANCKNECPYGYDKAFCFPCYKKIMSEMPIRKRG